MFLSDGGKNHHPDKACIPLLFTFAEMKSFKLSRKLLFYLGFFGLLLLGFYLMIRDERPFTDAKLVVINANIPDFHFIDQNGDTISQEKTEGKVYVAAYFFTTCKGICPKMNLNMRRIYDKFKNEEGFLILSHTCMPETDSQRLLKEYERKMLSGNLIKSDNGSYKMEGILDTNEINKNKIWHFLTGDKNELYKLARQGYLIDDGKSDSTQRIENQFIHTQFFALVDKFGRVRGIYDGLVEEEIQKLMNDIPAVMAEKVDHTRFLNGFSSSPN